jgi:uncharacterized protein
MGPVRGAARIDVLDVLRGIAILGIFYMNIPFMGSAVWWMFTDLRSVGWSPADQHAWFWVQVIAEGTQRGVLEMLFGAGVMVLTARGTDSDGSVAVADLYLRRNLWLLAFGMFDVFVMLWPGDILHVYAIAALFLFPFRRLPPRWLVIVGFLFATWSAVNGTAEYVSRTGLQTRVEAARAHQGSAADLTPVDRQALAEWRKKLDRLKPDAERRALIAQEDKAHADGGLGAYGRFLWGAWFALIGKGSLISGVIEAFSVMLIGIALWKWRVIQGGRSPRFYLGLAVACYAFGFGARTLGATEIMSFRPIPKTIWATAEYARIATSLGHVALVNLLMQTGAGRIVLAPFKAAGRTAFSLYFLETIIGTWVLFAPFGLNWWRTMGYAGLATIATITITGLLVVANVWSRYFVSGPLEWVWRSLSYLKAQPFRRRRGRIDPEPLPEPSVVPA